MKKILCCIICLLIVFGLVGCKKSTNGLSDSSNPNGINGQANAEDGESPIPQKPIELMQRTVSNDVEFVLVDSKDKVWLENEDVEGVLIVYKKGQNRYLELRFTEEGTKKFKKAVRRNKKSTLIVKLDGEVLIPSVVANELSPDCARADGKYENVVDWFNKLT